MQSHYCRDCCQLPPAATAAVTSNAQRVRRRIVDAGSAVPEADDEARSTSDAAAGAERLNDSYVGVRCLTRVIFFKGSVEDGQKGKS